MVNKILNIFRKQRNTIIVVYCWVNDNYVNIDCISDSKFHDTIKYMYNHNEANRKYFDGYDMYNIYCEFAVVEI